jgi:hypothetical protein
MPLDTREHAAIIEIAGNTSLFDLDLDLEARSR